MKRLTVLLSTLILTACLEPQPAPDVMDISSADFYIEVVSNDISKPWGVAVLPDGSYLVTEFEGGLKHLKNNQTINISGLPEDLYVNGQGGFMGITLAPDFNETGDVYLSYAYGNKTLNGTAVYRAQLNNGSLENGQTIFKATGKDTGSHFGGRMVFMPDETLVLTLGDGFTYREHAQKMDTHLGKIVRMNKDGSPAADNPFISQGEAKPHIYSYGHRNVQGLAYDITSGNLWAHEHGPRGGDELNLIKAGANYGWPLATTGTDYTGAKITPFKTMEDTEPFIYDWVPSIAPSGLIIYRGEQFPDWQGDAFIGALAGTSLWRIDLDGRKAVGETRLLFDLGERVRDVAQDNDGAILVLTETEHGGLLRRITPKP